MSTIALDRFATAMQSSTDYGRDVPEGVVADAHAEMVADALRSCTPWCTVNHEVEIRESMPQETYMHRVVIADLDDASVYVERWDSVDFGPVSPTAIAVYGDAGESMTAEQARAFAAALLNAADKLDEISR